MKKSKTNRQRKLARSERDNQTWLETRTKSFDARRDLAAEILSELLLKERSGACENPAARVGGSE